MTHSSSPSTLSFMLNGELRTVYTKPSETLLFVLRDRLGLTGPKRVCENGDCGACTVLLSGKPVKACLILAVEVQGLSVQTVEGIEDQNLKKAFVEEGGFQCGFCTSGFITLTHSIFRDFPEIPEEQIRKYLSGNLCRCTGYEGISRALAAYREKRKER